MTRVALSEEQVMLAATTAQLVADHPTVLDPGPERAPIEAKLWESLVECGLVGLTVPEERRGAGGSTMDAAVVIEQLARGLSAAPYLGTVLAVGLVLAAAPSGNELADLLAGRPGCVVLDTHLATPSGIGIGVDVAHDSLVVGVDSEAACLSELGAQLDSVDLSRSLARVIGVEERLGPIATDALVRWRAQALALTCADLVGVATGALEACVAHARNRHQFGRPVGSFQAVQQLCADQLVDIEGCRSITWHAAWGVDALEPAEALALSQVAKAHCSEVGRNVCEAAIQVWGGTGITWDCPAHRYLRRALLDRQLFGDERVQLTAIADRRLGSPPKGAN